MKNFDNHIKEIFSEKLGQLESEVSPQLWNNISSQLTNTAASATVGKTLLAKFAWAAAIGVVGTIATIALVSRNNNTITTIAEPVNDEIRTTEPVNHEIRITEPVEMDLTNSEVVTPAIVQNTATTNLKTDQSSDDIASRIAHSVSSDNSAPTFPSSSENSATGSSEHDTKDIPIGLSPVDKIMETVSSMPATTTAAHVEKLNAAFTVRPVSEMRYFFIPQEGQAKSYDWNFGDGATSGEMSPAHSYTEEGDFTVSLVVTGQDGKMETFESTVKVTSPVELLIPTVFTPDGDGKNDYFLIKVISGEIKLTKIVVFNNEGRVFESDGDTMWDGHTPVGEPSPVGTYTYLVRGIDRNQAVIEKSGMVTLLR